MYLLLYFWLNDFVFFGAAILVYFCSATEDVVTLVGIRTIEARIPFPQSVHVSRAVFWAQNGWNTEREKWVGTMYSEYVNEIRKGESTATTTSITVGMNPPKNIIVFIVSDVFWMYFAYCVKPVNVTEYIYARYPIHNFLPTKGEKRSSLTSFIFQNVFETYRNSPVSID